MTDVSVGLCWHCLGTVEEALDFMSKDPSGGRANIQAQQ